MFLGYAFLRSTPPDADEIPDFVETGSALTLAEKKELRSGQVLSPLELAILRQDLAEVMPDVPPDVALERLTEFPYVYPTGDENDLSAVSYLLERYH